MAAEVYFSLILLFGLSTLPNVISLCTPDNKPTGTDSQGEVAAINRIISLVGLKWDKIIGPNGSYSLTICGEGQKLAGAVWHTKKEDVVLGFLNRTHAASGESFVILEYRGGNSSNSPICHGNFSSQIFIVCSPHLTEQVPPKFLEQAGCEARFELLTPVVCPPESPPVAPIILGWTVFIFTLYCLVGILYRRFFLQARGRQQLPHFGFWSRIGRCCADGCNLLCRCEEEAVSRWDADDDRDDVLLRP